MPIATNEVLRAFSGVDIASIRVGHSPVVGRSSVSSEDAKDKARSRNGTFYTEWGDWQGTGLPVVQVDISEATYKALRGQGAYDDTPYI